MNPSSANGRDNSPRRLARALQLTGHVSNSDKWLGKNLRGKWHVDGVLGSGGMATVYSATHRIGRRDAIKVLHEELTASDDICTRFEQEAIAVNHIDHPSIVKIRDFDYADDGTPFMVMELLHGATLEDIANRSVIGYTLLLDVIDQLLDVLATAHAHGVIHRDIKPENLFLQRDGSLKTLDFGIARVGRHGLRTQAGTMMGTVAFMPPEQINGIGVDHRVDLYAAAATLFTLLTGRHVHEANSELAAVARMLVTPAPRLATIVPTAPTELCRVVDCALAFNPEHRYPDAATMRRDLWHAREGVEPPYATARLDADRTPGLLEITARKRTIVGWRAIETSESVSRGAALRPAPKKSSAPKKSLAPRKVRVPRPQKPAAVAKTTVPEFPVFLDLKDAFSAAPGKTIPEFPAFEFCARRQFP